MSQQKRPPNNPLLGVSNFNLEDSFGTQPTLIVPTTSTSTNDTSNLFQSQTTSENAFSDVMLNSGPPPPVKPPPVMSLGPPTPGLFLLPNSTSTSILPPTGEQFYARMSQFGSIAA